MDMLNVQRADIAPRPSAHIPEQIEVIEDLIKKGFAYEANGSVYFDVHKFNETHDYGILSKRKLEDLIHNTRELDGQSDKKNPQDFALWKKAEPQHIMRWPGWHLECTAMSTKYLGDHFDIHGGGMDLKFPHHECEIAQNEAAKGQAPVNYWMHANMLQLNGQRMSKSTGNIVNPDELLSGNNTFFSKAFAPSVIRFFNAQAHYRSVLDLTDDGLLSSERGFYRLMDAINLLDGLKTSGTSSIDVKSWKKACYNAMNDDFNSPILIANLFEAVKYINQVKEGSQTLNSEDLVLLKETMHAFTFDVLGLKNVTIANTGTDKLSAAVDILIRLRQEARANKDFALSDKIRDELAEAGIQLKDGKEGTSFSLS